MELVKIRAGKATPSMLQTVVVDYYGSPTPLNQVANIATMDARTLTVQPWEKSSLDAIMKGIIDSNLGFAPQNNGEMLIISVPPLTEERRKELVKRAKTDAEHAKVVITSYSIHYTKLYDAESHFQRLFEDPQTILHLSMISPCLTLPFCGYELRLSHVLHQSWHV